MRFSVCVDPGRPWVEVVGLVRQLDEVGWDGVYVCDHFMPFDSDGLPTDGAMLEGWTSLAALAGQTSRVRLGTLVLGSTYRHPAVLANMAATMDHVTGGRFVLGIGAGGQVNEHVAYGIPLAPVAARLDAFEEACGVIRSLLREPRTSFVGDTFHLADAPCDPKPIQDPLPMLIGGGGEQRTLRIAARFGDEWHAWASPAVFRHKSGVLDRRCAELGRDPSTISRSTGAMVMVSTAVATTQRGAGKSSDAQSPAEALDLVGAYRAAGADEFIVRDSCRTPVGAALEALSLFWTEVAPHLR